MLFDENIGFINFGFSPMDKEKEELVSVNEGFLRGNMFKSLYKPYKKYTYGKIVPKSKREELLLDVMALSFAVNDLNLYLDLNPKDEDKLKKFKEVVEKLHAKQMEFVRMYGPLELVESDSVKNFEWINDPWPWQNDGGAKYV